MEELPIKYIKDKDGRFIPITSPSAVITEDGRNIYDIFVASEEATGSEIEPTILDNYYTKAEYSNLDSVKFLNDEYEKTLNVLGLMNTQYTVSGVTFTVKDGEITINGTANSDISWYPKLYKTIPAGEYSLNLIIVGGTYTGNSRFGLSVNSWFEDLSATLLAPTKTSNLGSATSETIMYVNNQQTFNNLKIRPMLVKGSSIPTEFHQYNGAIVHQKDITPVTLWSGVTSGRQILTMSESEANFEFIIVEGRSGTEYSTIAVRNPDGKNLVLNQNNMHAYKYIAFLVYGTTFDMLGSENMELTGVYGLIRR